MQKKTRACIALCIVFFGLQGLLVRPGAVLALGTGAPSTTNASSPWIEVAGIQNARQLGGYPTRAGGRVRPEILLRTGELAELTDADRDQLTRTYPLAHVIDLRDEIETENAPDPELEGAQYHHLNVWPRAVRQRIIEESTSGLRFDAEQYVLNYYAAFALEPSAIAAYRAMFEILLQSEDGGVLIHCVHGKDRTGIASALILYALDVEWAVIEQEYLLSNHAIAGSVDVSSLRHYRGTVEDAYGSMENYLEVEMGLDAKRLHALREKYTTGG